LFPIPYEEASSLFSRTSPRDWLTEMSRAQRVAWLARKRKALTSLPPAVKDVLFRLESKCPPPPASRLLHPPRRPDFLKRPRGVDAVALLRNIFAGSKLAPRVDQHLEDILRGGRYSTLFHEDRWKIVAPAPTGGLQDLAGLAHELGHVLNDGRTSDHSLSMLTRSEATALALEELIVSRILASDERREWETYQRALDEYGFCLFREEMRFVTGDETSGAELLLLPSFVFRESLWSYDGYQAVFAAASLIRRRVLGIGRSQEMSLLAKTSAQSA
jgi:hypothetical protein